MKTSDIWDSSNLSHGIIILQNCMSIQCFIVHGLKTHSLPGLRVSHQTQGIHILEHHTRSQTVILSQKVHVSRIIKVRSVVNVRLAMNVRLVPWSIQPYIALSSIFRINHQLHPILLPHRPVLFVPVYLAQHQHPLQLPILLQVPRFKSPLSGLPSCLNW